MEQSPPLHQVSKVCGVEARRRQVKRSKFGVAAVGKASGLAGASEDGIDVGLVVDAVLEESTLGKSDDVAT